MNRVHVTMFGPERELIVDDAELLDLERSGILLGDAVKIGDDDAPAEAEDKAEQATADAQPDTNPDQIPDTQQAAPPADTAAPAKVNTAKAAPAAEGK